MSDKVTLFVGKVTNSRKRKEPNYSILQYLDGTTSAVANCKHAAPQDYFRRVYFEAIDCIIMALNERFNKPCFDVFATMETLLLKAIAGEEINDELAWMHSRYADDVDATALKTELLVFKQIFKEKLNHFDDILKAMEETTSTAAYKPRHKCHPRKIIFCCKKNQDLAAINHDTV